MASYVKKDLMYSIVFCELLNLEMYFVMENLYGCVVHFDQVTMKYKLYCI